MWSSLACGTARSSQRNANVQQLASAPWKPGVIPADLPLWLRNLSRLIKNCDTRFLTVLAKFETLRVRQGSASGNGIRKPVCLGQGYTFCVLFPPPPPQHELQCGIAWIATTTEIGGSATGGRCRSTSRIPVGSIASAVCHGNTRCKLDARPPLPCCALPSIPLQGSLMACSRGARALESLS